MPDVRSALYARPSDELAHLTTPVLTTGTADANYPVTNVVTFDPAAPFLTSSSGTAVDIDLDHGSEKDVQYVSLHHTNIPAGSVVRVQRGATIGETTMNVLLPIPAYPQAGLPLPIGLDLTGAAAYGAYRWTRLHIDSLAQKVGIGSFLCWQTKRQDLTNVTYPVQDGEDQRSALFRTSFGVRRGRRLGIRLRSQPTVFRFTTDAMYASFLTLFRELTPSNGCLWVRDPVSTDAWLVGLSADALATSLPTNRVHDVPVTIEELACGAALPTA